MSRHSTRHRLVALTLAFVALATAACNNGDDDSDDNADKPDETTTTTTQPPAAGDTEEEAFDIVESLVLEATSLADALVQDPEAVNDEDNEDIERLKEIYTDDSNTPENVIEGLQGLVERGQHLQPAASGVFREISLREFEASDENTVVFKWCALQDQETVGTDGTVVEQRAQVTQGTGEARRIDERWQFYGLQPDPNLTIPGRPGQAESGTCDRLYPDGGTDS